MYGSIPDLFNMADQAQLTARAVRQRVIDVVHGVALLPVDVMAGRAFHLGATDQHRLRNRLGTKARHRGIRHQRRTADEIVRGGRGDIVERDRMAPAQIRAEIAQAARGDDGGGAVGDAIEGVYRRHAVMAAQARQRDARRRTDRLAHRRAAVRGERARHRRLVIPQGDARAQRRVMHGVTHTAERVRRRVPRIVREIVEGVLDA